MSQLNGKVALVTGVASKSSIGRAVALMLAKEGANLVVVDKYAVPQNLMSADVRWGGLNSVVSEIEALGGKALGVTGDISDSKDIDIIINKCLEKFSKIDIMVHCAGTRGSMTTPIIDIAEQEWKTVLDVNLNGTFLIAKAVAKEMVNKGQGGKIVLIASMGGVKGMPGSGAYSVSKFGVIGLMKTLALEVAKYNINVNAVNPGAVASNLRDGFYKDIAKAEGITIEEARDRHYQKAVAGIPLSRMGTPEDIASMVLFLVTDQSSYITGEAFNVSGGVN
jgi:3-oxoacyl-[acyl-carrier protein] reductase/meso-butanediol dehydrogenase/(S,S)-butanediol dehydrogenase/diacetyl reductase